VFNKHQHDIEQVEQRKAVYVKQLHVILQQQMQTQLHMAHLEQERKRKQFEEEQKLEVICSCG
jgi:hypothetical protein